MKRSKATIPTKIYSFGCLRPDEDSRAVLEKELRIAADYTNELVVIENRRREQDESVLSGSCPEYAEAKERAEQLTAQINAAYDELAKKRAKARKRIIPDDFEALINGLKKERAEAWRLKSAAAKEFRKNVIRPTAEAFKAEFVTILECEGNAQNNRRKAVLRPELFEQYRRRDGVSEDWVMTEEAHLGAVENGKAARARARDAGLSTYTMEFAKEAFIAASAKTLVNGKMIKARQSTFEGRVGVAFQATAPGVVAQDGSMSHARFTLQPNVTDRDNRTSDKAKQRRRMVARMKIGDQWLEFRCLVHRPMPAGAVVKRAWVMVHKRGDRTAYSLQLSVQSPEFAWRVPGKRLEAVALKPTWKKRDDGGIVAAEWLGSDGQSGKITLEAEANEKLLYPDLLRGWQDDHHNEARRVLRLWSRVSGVDLEIHTNEGPQPLSVLLKHCNLWRSPMNLARIAYHLTKQEVPDADQLWVAWRQTCGRNESDLFQPMSVVRRWLKARGRHSQTMAVAVYLEWWRRKNRHLLTVARNTRSKAQGRRKDHYRVAAYHLAARYERLVICGVDLKSAAKKKKAEETVDGPEKLWTGQRRRAAPSELKSAVCNAFRVKEKEVRTSEKDLKKALNMT